MKAFFQKLQTPFVIAALSLVRQVFSIDVRSLAAMRMALAAVVVADTFERIVDCRAFSEGLGLNFIAIQQTTDPVSSLLPALSLCGLSPSLSLQYTILGIRLVAALFLFAGYYTRLAVLFSFILNQSVMLNNPYGLNGGDVLLNLLLLLGIFLPLGRVFSFDAQRIQTAPAKPIYNGATASILILIGMVYWANMLAKSYVPAWHMDYTALEYALRYSSTTRPFGDFLLGYPSVLKLFTQTGIWLELYVPILVFVPIATARIRAVAVPVMIFFHAIAINFCMDIGWFGLIIAAAWLLFLPTMVWDYLAAWNWATVTKVAPGLGRLHESVVDLIARVNRKRPFIIASQLERPETRRWRFAGNLFCVALMGTLLFLNIGALAVSVAGQSLENGLGYCIRNQFLNCGWAMYENPANFRQRWATIEITRADGRKEVIDNKFLVAKPDYKSRLSDLFPNERWRKVYERVRKDDKMEKSTVRSKFACYVVREWCLTKEIPFTDIKEIKMISNEAPLLDAGRNQTVRKTLTVDSFFLDKFAFGNRWSPIPDAPVEAPERVAQQAVSTPVLSADKFPASTAGGTAEPSSGGEGLDTLSLQLVPN